MVAYALPVRAVKENRWDLPATHVVRCRVSNPEYNGPGHPGTCVSDLVLASSHVSFSLMIARRS